MPVIIHGIKIRRHKAGHVAGFCVVCRGLRPFRLLNMHRTSHVYFIPMGRGTLVGHEMVCLECETAHTASPEFFSNFVDELLPLDELLQRTVATNWPALKERVELEEKVRTDLRALSPEEREGLLWEVFSTFMTRVEARFSQMHVDPWMAFLLLLFLPLSFLLAVLTQEGNLPVHSDWVIIAVVGAYGVFFIWQGLLSGRRWMRRHILPMMARSLRLLKPTAAELAATVDRCKKVGWAIGRRTRIKDLMRLLDNAAPTRAEDNTGSPR